MDLDDLGRQLLSADGATRAAAIHRLEIVFSAEPVDGALFRDSSDAGSGDAESFALLSKIFQMGEESEEREIHEHLCAAGERGLRRFYAASECLFGSSVTLGCDDRPCSLGELVLGYWERLVLHEETAIGLCAASALMNVAAQLLLDGYAATRCTSPDDVCRRWTNAMTAVHATLRALGIPSPTRNIPDVATFFFRYLDAAVAASQSRGRRDATLPEHGDGDGAESSRIVAHAAVTVLRCVRLCTQEGNDHNETMERAARDLLVTEQRRNLLDTIFLRRIVGHAMETRDTLLLLNVLQGASQLILRIPPTLPTSQRACDAFAANLSSALLDRAAHDSALLRPFVCDAMATAVWNCSFAVTRYATGRHSRGRRRRSEWPTQLQQQQPQESDMPHELDDDEDEEQDGNTASGTDAELLPESKWSWPAMIARIALQPIRGVSTTDGEEKEDEGTLCSAWSALAAFCTTDEGFSLVCAEVLGDRSFERAAEYFLARRGSTDERCAVLGFFSCALRNATGSRNDARRSGHREDESAVDDAVMQPRGSLLSPAVFQAAWSLCKHPEPRVRRALWDVVLAACSSSASAVVGPTCASFLIASYAEEPSVDVRDVQLAVARALQRLPALELLYERLQLRVVNLGLYPPGNDQAGVAVGSRVTR